MADYLYDFFISYHRQDEPLANSLYQLLSQEYRVFLDKEHIDNSSFVKPQFDKALDQTNILLQIVAPNRPASYWVEFERSRMLYADPANRSKRFYVLSNDGAKLAENIILDNEFYLDWQALDLANNLEIFSGILQNQPAPTVVERMQITHPRDDNYWCELSATAQIAKFAVTNQLYKEYVQSCGIALPEHFGQSQSENSQPFGKDDHPIVNVNCDDAIKFCRWLENDLKQHGDIDEGEQITLPTEAQWRAVAEPEGYQYPWKKDGINEGYANYGWNHECTKPVNSYAVAGNMTQVYGILGNVWEWGMNTSQLASKAPIFGGSWGSGLKYLTQQGRVQTIERKVRNEFTGFRLVKTKIHA